MAFTSSGVATSNEFIFRIPRRRYGCCQNTVLTHTLEVCSRRQSSLVSCGEKIHSDRFGSVRFSNGKFIEVPLVCWKPSKQLNTFRNIHKSILNLAVSEQKSTAISNFSSSLFFRLPITWNIAYRQYRQIIRLVCR